jgi:hypothetical protein
MSSNPPKDFSKSISQFYTNPLYASKFLDIVKTLLPFDIYHLLLEPSAGTGSFYKLLDNRRVGLDIDPKCEGVINQNFLMWYPEVDKVLTIGNPPFGKNSSLAVSFFNHAAEFSDVIAFILPKTFRKASIINRLNNRFNIIFDDTVPPNSFIYNGKSYDVPCCCQIWVRSETIREKIKVKSINDVISFFILTTPENADIAIQRVGVNAGKIKKGDLSKYSVSSHYFIKIIDNRSLKILENIDFSSVKYNTAGNPSISIHEMVGLFLHNIS